MNVRIYNGFNAPTLRHISEFRNETYRLLFDHIDKIEGLSGACVARIAHLCAGLAEAELRKVEPLIGE